MEILKNIGIGLVIGCVVFFVVIYPFYAASRPNNELNTTKEYEILGFTTVRRYDCPDDVNDLKNHLRTFLREKLSTQEARDQLKMKLEGVNLTDELQQYEFTEELVEELYGIREIDCFKKHWGTFYLKHLQILGREILLETVNPFNLQDL